MAELLMGVWDFNKCLHIRDHFLRANWLMALAILVGCASKTKLVDSPLEVPSGPVTIEMRGKTGREEQMKNYYRAVTETFEEGKIRHQKDEAVEFTVRNQIKKVTADGVIEFLVDTIDKDGPVDLHDLAYPENGESFDYVVTKTGRVLKAGDYPPHSVFFIPPVPVPMTSVQAGETWEMEHDWVSHNTGLPLTLNIVGIFRGLKSCGKNDRCAEIELSGTVYVPKGVLREARLKSDLRGSMLFSVNEGMLVATDITTVEELTGNNARVLVRSCTVSRLAKPEGYFDIPKSLECDPHGLPEERIR